MKKYKFIIFSFIALILLIPTLYLSILSLYNINHAWKKTLNLELPVSIQNIKSQKLIYESHKISELKLYLNETTFSAFVKSPKVPKNIALLFTGRRTGKDAIAYLASVFKSSIIIAMDYPFKKKRYTFWEGLRLFFKGRKDLYNLTRVSQLFLEYVLQNQKNKLPIFSAGVSFGTPFAYQLAAIEPKIDAIIYCYGFNNIRGMFEYHLNYQFKNVILKKLCAFLFDIFFYQLEPNRWINENKEKLVLFLKGSQDEDVPPHFIDPFIAQHSNSKIFVFPGKHLRADNYKLMKKLSLAVQKWLLSFATKR